MHKPTFTDVNGVKIVCRVTEDPESPHLVVSTLADDGTLTPIMELNNHDAKYLGNACDVYLKQSWSKWYGGSLADMSPDAMEDVFGADGASNGAASNDGASKNSASNDAKSDQ
ncbi:hypothetical protein [uncultured Corynebacterium sp.]|uniref:hypothetical protein n=1 Tax=uncultured Corynebacterium sp. TaxID=159447 RepID=UPI0025E21F35|nr:hypothetical protein [uncultured Corynebacterium sp.]